MKQSATDSQGQVEAFATVMGLPNDRPVQAVNARAILKQAFDPRPGMLSADSATS